MKLMQIKDALPDHFRQLMVIKRSTFDAIIKILQVAKERPKVQGAKPN